MYSVIATDLDGTLLNSDHQLDPFTAETVRTLAARGVPIVIATGRHYRDVAGIRDLLGVDAYLITSNGARVHAPGDERIYSRDLDPAAVRRLVQPDLAGGEGRVIVNLFADDAWLIDRHAPELPCTRSLPPISTERCSTPTISWIRSRSPRSPS